jgi:hypothetical protein
MRNGMLDGSPEEMGALSGWIGQAVDDQRKHLTNFMSCTDNVRAGFQGPPADLNDEGAMNCYSDANVTVVQRGEEQQSGVMQLGNMYDSNISFQSSAMSGILNPGAV